jgi:hypothetical protein
MDLTSAIRLIDELTAHGVTIPAAAETARATHAAAHQAANTHPADDLRTALTDGRMTPDNAADMIRDAALASVARQAAHEMIRDLSLVLARQITAAIREESPAILEQLRARFAPAAATVTKAAQTFPPNVTAAQVVTMKPADIKVWNDLDNATATLEAVARSFRTLLTEVTRRRPEHDGALFVTEVDDLDELGSIYRGRDRWLELARAGYTLTLNSPERAAALVTAATEAEAAREAARKATRRAGRFSGV